MTSPHNPQTPSRSSTTIIETQVTESSSRTVISKDHRGNWVTLSMHEGDFEYRFPVMAEIKYMNGTILSLGSSKAPGTLYAECHKSQGGLIGPLQSAPATDAFIQVAMRILKKSSFTAAHAAQIEQFVTAVNTEVLTNPPSGTIALGHALEKRMVEIQNTEFVQDAAGNMVCVALDKQTHTGYIDMIAKNGKHMRIDFSPNEISDAHAEPGTASHRLSSPRVAAEFESFISNVYANNVTTEEATALSALAITVSSALEKPEASRAPNVSGAIKKIAMKK